MDSRRRKLYALLGVSITALVVGLYLLFNGGC